MRKSKAILLLFIIILGVCSGLVLLLPRLETSTLDIERLDKEPENYFVLTEEDLEKYHALRKALEEMKKKQVKQILYDVPKEEGYAIFCYMLERQRQVWNPSLKSKRMSLQYV